MSQTTLMLRNTELALSHDHDSYPTCNLILLNCVVHSITKCFSRFPNLEVIVAGESSDGDSLLRFNWLPNSVRHVHILQRDFEDLQEYPAPAINLPALETFTLTWLRPDAGQSESLSASVATPLSDLRKYVEATIVAPQCTFKYFRSTKASEDTLADAMAELGLDSS